MDMSSGKGGHVHSWWGRLRGTARPDWWNLWNLWNWWNLWNLWN